MQKVTTKGEEGYEMLKECLLRSGQYSLYNVLENAEKGQDADQEILRLGVEIEKEARQRKSNLLFENLTLFSIDAYKKAI